MKGSTSQLLEYFDRWLQEENAMTREQAREMAKAIVQLTQEAAAGFGGFRANYDLTVIAELADETDEDPPPAAVAGT